MRNLFPAAWAAVRARGRGEGERASDDRGQRPVLVEELGEDASAGGRALLEEG